jgi:hypothetical protein
MELAARAVLTGMQWWRPTAAAVAPLEGEAFGGPAAEKLAAELLWLAQKMAACGAAREAAVQFGAAPRLGSRALVAEPTLQVALLRLAGTLYLRAARRTRRATAEPFRSAHRRIVNRHAFRSFCAVFLFRHANSAEFEQHSGEGEGGKAAVAEQRMAMLRSWLPLLCRGSTGTDAPVLSGRERAEMVEVLEELIEKLRWEQQEEALALWLHHFAACPDTDWPNLESCYTRWYAESRKLLA